MTPWFWKQEIKCQIFVTNIYIKYLWTFCSPPNITKSLFDRMEMVIHDRVFLLLSCKPIRGCFFGYFFQSVSHSWVSHCNFRFIAVQISCDLYDIYLKILKGKTTALCWRGIGVSIKTRSKLKWIFLINSIVMINNVKTRNVKTSLSLLCSSIKSVHIFMQMT